MSPAPRSSGRIKAKLVKPSPNLVEFKPNWAKPGPSLVKFYPSFVDSTPTLVELGQTLNLVGLKPEFGEPGPNPAEFSPPLVAFKPNLAARNSPLSQVCTSLPYPAPLFEVVGAWWVKYDFGAELATDKVVKKSAPSWIVNKEPSFDNDLDDPCHRRPSKRSGT